MAKLVLKKESRPKEEQSEQSAVIAELEQDEVQPQKSDEATIEEKYDQGQARIVIQRNDFLVPNILQMVKDRNILDLSPNYQRRARWTDVKRSHLIESLLMNIPIPPIFLYEKDLAQYEVMDGQQRLSAIRSFFENGFALRNLKKWPELDGRFFKDLPGRIQGGLNRRGLAAVIILTESGHDAETAMELRQYVFERLNTGGQMLNAQEVRNCIYASRFNDLLVKLSRSGHFTAAWGIPPKEPGEPHKVSAKLETNQLYSSMADCEIVLRYFALSGLDNFKSGMKRTLDSYMSKQLKATAAECATFDKEYSQVLQIAFTTYREALFKLPKNGSLSGRRSVPLADAVLLAIRTFLSKGDKIIARRDRILKKTMELLQAKDSYEALVPAANEN
jgi:hypothetical protein